MSSTVRRVRRFLIALAIVSMAFAGCGGDDSRPDRTIAFLRAVAAKGSVSPAFLGELEDAGWKDGDNLTILAADAAEAHLDPEDATKTLQEWERKGTDLVIALSTIGAKAAHEAVPDVPVLFLVNDPTASGLVTNERAPEGNLTGVTFRVPPERTLEVAAALGDLTTVGLLWPSEDPAAAPVRDGLVAAAQALHLGLVDEDFTDDADVAGAVQRLADAGSQVIVLANAPTTVRSFAAIEAAVASTKLPVVANTACAFAVVVLSPDIDTLNAQLGRQAGRLLRGVAVRNIPVEDPGAFTLSVHRDVAGEIGFDVPRQLVDRADEVTG